MSRNAASTSASRSAPRRFSRSKTSPRRPDKLSNIGLLRRDGPQAARIGGCQARGGVVAAAKLGAAVSRSQAEGRDCAPFRGCAAASGWPLFRAMDELAFHKMHGLGNDFVILDRRSGKLSLSAAADPAHRRPSSRRGLRSAVEPGAVGAGGRVHAGVQSGRFRVRRLRQRHPLRRPAGHGGAGRRAGDASRPRRAC